jgi:hypothetical protein
MTLDKHHIILYAVAIVFALGLTYTIESGVADRAEQKYEKAQAIADLKDQQNIQFQQQIQATIQQLQTQNTQLQAISAQQATTINSLQKQLTTQKANDATLPPSGLAQRIQSLAPGGTITVVATGYNLDQAEAVSIAQALEEPPVLKQELAADDTIIKNDTAIIINDAKVLDAEKQSHGSDVSAMQAKLDAANLEIKDVKAKARKGKLKFFGIGYIAGFASSEILKAFVPSFRL